MMRAILFASATATSLYGLRAMVIAHAPLRCPGWGGFLGLLYSAGFGHALSACECLRF